VHDYAVKFWVIADNLTDDVSEIVHIEIPNTLDKIVYTPIRKHSREYAELDRLFLASLFDT
jgi:hypothetical protein